MYQNWQQYSRVAREVIHNIIFEVIHKTRYPDKQTYLFFSSISSFLSIMETIACFSSPAQSTVLKLN